MAKKNTLNDLNEFLKETQEGQEAKTTTTKEEFLAKEPSKLVDVNKVEKPAAKKATAKKTAAKTTTKKTTATKPAAKKATTKTTASKPAAKKTTAKTTATKPAAQKTTAKKTTAKTTATKTTTPKTTAKKTTAKKATPAAEVTEEFILKQLDALAQKEGVTMREIWERVARKVGATAEGEKPTMAEEAFESLVDIAMTPMNLLVSVSDRINKML